jgi:CHASE3 domain sensor protein
MIFCLPHAVYAEGALGAEAVPSAQPAMPDNEDPAGNENDNYEVGVLITDLYDIDVSGGTFKADFWLWSVHPEEADNGLDGLSFVNAATVEQTCRTAACGKKYRTLKKVRGTFRHEWNTQNFPFDRHKIGIVMEGLTKKGQERDYCIDTRNSTFDSSISSRLHGWAVTRFSLQRDDVLYASTLGDPSRGRGSSFAQIKIGLFIEREELTSFLKLASPAYIAFMVAALSFFLIGHREGLGIELCIGALFAAVINMIAISGSLGKTPSLTWLDKIHIIILFYILAACIVGVTCELLRKEDGKPFSLRTRWILFIVAIISFLVANLVLVRAARARFRSIEDLAHAIQYEDEVLTQSVRNYVFTGNEKWLNRYRAHAKTLDDVIEEAVQRGDGHAKDLVEGKTKKANNELLRLEKEAIELMKEEEVERARALLDSEEYETQKKIYSGGIKEYFDQISPNYLNHLAYVIRYEDEVLTQSARMYAFTGDDQWRKRYDSHVDVLAEAIRDATENGDAVDQKIFQDIEDANDALVEMELRAMKLVRQGKENEAAKLLDSPEYWENKTIYSQGLEAYFRRHVD